MKQIKFEMYSLADMRPKNNQRVIVFLGEGHPTFASYKSKEDRFYIESHNPGWFDNGDIIGWIDLTSGVIEK